MSVLTYILLSTLPLLFALGAYFWYVTPSPQDLAEEVLRHSKPTKRGKIFSATKPQLNMTHINCLS
jgi:hypothetical protein